MIIFPFQESRVDRSCILLNFWVLFCESLLYSKFRMSAKFRRIRTTVRNFWNTFSIFKQLQKVLWPIFSLKCIWNKISTIILFYRWKVAALKRHKDRRLPFLDIVSSSKVITGSEIVKIKETNGNKSHLKINQNLSSLWRHILWMTVGWIFKQAVAQWLFVKIKWNLVHVKCKIKWSR